MTETTETTVKTETTDAPKAETTLKVGADGKVKRRGAGLTVTSKNPAGRSRGGMKFTAEKTYVPNDAMTDEQYAAITADPYLHVFYGKDETAVDYVAPGKIADVSLSNDGPATQAQIDAHEAALPVPATPPAGTTLAPQLSEAEKAAAKPKK